MVAAAAARGAALQKIESRAAELRASLGENFEGALHKDATNEYIPSQHTRLHKKDRYGADEIRGIAAAEKGQDPLRNLRATHAQLMHGVTNIREKTASVLAEQERDLLRAFRARLYDLQKELELERSKNADGAREWIDKSRRLGKELDASREEALRLGREHGKLTQEVSQLRSEVQSNKKDREILFRQLIAQKKEIGRLSRNLEAVGVKNGGEPSTEEEDYIAVRSSSRGGSSQGMRPIPLLSAVRPSSAMRPASALLGYRPMSAATGTKPPPTSKLPFSEDENPPCLGDSLQGGEGIEARKMRDAKDMEQSISRLRSMLETERRSMRALKYEHKRELESRSELEKMLRSCVDDVRREIAIQRAGRGASRSGRTVSAGSSRNSIPVNSLSPAERDRVLELLLSQERVVALLYDKTFPPSEDQGVQAPTAAAALTSARIVKASSHKPAQAPPRQKPAAVPSKNDTISVTHLSIPQVYQPTTANTLRKQGLRGGVRTSLPNKSLSL